jgi:hypothetical protein
MKASTLIQVTVVGGLFVESPGQNRRDYGTRKIVRLFSETTVAAERVEVAIALAKLREAEKQRLAAEVRIKRFLRELGYGS